MVSFARLRKEHIEPARCVGSARTNLGSAAKAMLDYLSAHRKLVVTGVPTQTLGDLRDVYGYLVEPAYCRGCTLVLEADRALDDLEETDFVDPDFEYPWTLQRLHHIARQWLREERDPRLPPMTPIEWLLYDAMMELGLAPRSQYGIERFRADFAFPEARLTVECDGRAWHDAQRDARRDALLGKLGWEVVRFTGSEIWRDAKGVADAVRSLLADRARLVTYTPLVEDEPVATPVNISLWERLLAWFRAQLRRDADARGGFEMPLPEVLPASLTACLQLHDLDDEQRTAVGSHEGVTQIIAPAGSGKTRVMVFRVKELLARGVPANRILCTTFNADAVGELGSRLRAEGIEGVTTKSFHAIGRQILDEEGRLRDDIGGLSYAQWRYHARAAMAQTEDGVWIDAPDAKDAVGDLKLGAMLTPSQAEMRARDPLSRTVACLYRLYEEALFTAAILDFDDLIIQPIRLMQERADLREKWQSRWDFVLVDEYQDIEPAQELLVRMLAAPQDGLFVVGDEDQCIYAWRRASVERIIELDQTYPGLERHVLKRNYRSGKRIVQPAANLITKNRKRFPKEIIAAGDGPGDVEVMNAIGWDDAAALVADRMKSHARGEAVVLARTTAQLRPVALALAARGKRFDAPEKLIRLTGAEKTLLAYCRLFGRLAAARPEDVAEVFKVPNRYLPHGAEEQVAKALRAGRGFSDAVGDLRGESWRLRKLEEGAAFFDRLSLVEDAADFIRAIRKEGLLDKHYADQEQMARHDPDAIDTLDANEIKAQGVAITPFSLELGKDIELLQRFHSKDEGVELKTIHGSKGLQWNEVVLFGLDENSLPHYRSLQGSTNGDAASGMEDERRLAYVAFTRARQRLVILTTDAPSPFLVEAGIMSESERDVLRKKIIAKRAEDSERRRGGVSGLALSNSGRTG